MPFVERGYDLGAWLRRVETKDEIVVHNSDFLLEFGGGEEEEEEGGGEGGVMKGVVFTGPRKAVASRLPPPVPLLPDEVRIKATCSLVSTGTEVKVFTGTLAESGEPLDTTIKGMSEDAGGYPFSYGYSSVGTIVEIGVNVPDHYLSKTAFTFSPHASIVTVDYTSVQLVPPGMSASTATFLPAVETALSLVHDASVVPGERVGVVGQGLIGLLVTGILGRMDVDVVTYEILEERRGLSPLFGAGTVLDPRTDYATTVKSADLDVCIEVTGAPAGLQTAIDSVGRYGRVVVGSMYGEDPLPVTLGLNFHRSRKTLIASQVSEVPCDRGGRWSKGRRFEKCWKVLAELPVERLVSVRVGVDECQRVYEMLERGEGVSAIFEYPPVNHAHTHRP